MDKDSLKRLAENPVLIEGIYNYCDRWCERCVFTARCLNFALSQEEFDAPEAHDMSNKAFWEKLQDSFQLAYELLQEAAERFGIDLEAIDTAVLDDDGKSIQDDLKKHPCYLVAKNYADMVGAWFDRTEDEERHAAYVESDGLDLVETEEIIWWYQHQIGVKLLRALYSRAQESAENESENEGTVRDSDGSAKVALIGIDRSIAAWGNMFDLFPVRKKEIMNILRCLEKLKHTVRSVFPDAGKFVRPGLDEMHQSGRIGNA